MAAVTTLKKLALVASVLVIAQSVYEKDRTAEFQRYWTDFRQAVIEENATKIVALTYFPFEVGGIVEWQCKSIDRKEFLAIIDQMLFQPTEHHSAGRDEIVNRHRITANDFDMGVSTELVIERFFFVRKTGRWWFTGVSVDGDSPLDERYFSGNSKQPNCRHLERQQN